MAEFELDPNGIWAPTGNRKTSKEETDSLYIPILEKDVANGVARLDGSLSLSDAVKAASNLQPGLVIYSDINNNVQTSTSNVNIPLPGIGITIPAGMGGNYLASFWCDLDGSSASTLINISLRKGATSQTGTTLQKRGSNESSGSIVNYPITLVPGDVVGINHSVGSGTGYFKNKGVILIKVS